MLFLLLIIFIGFFLLVKGANFFVEGSADIAKKLKVPELIVGLTIVAMGTSAPEAAVSISASLKGANDIAISNVTGSNIFNLLVVVGASAIIGPVIVDKSILKRDLPFSLLAAAIIVVLGIVFNNTFGIFPSLILILLFIVYMVVTVRSAVNQRQLNNISETVSNNKKPLKQTSIIKNIMFVLVGIGAIIVGGQLVVNASTSLARQFGLSETLIGLTICAIGTSLPELVTSIVASKKGMSDLAMGNAVGSCIFNLLFVFAFSSLFSPVKIAPQSYFDLFFLIAISIMILVVSITKKKINRTEGAIMIIAYAAYMAYIALR